MSPTGRRRPMPLSIENLEGRRLLSVAANHDGHADRMPHPSAEVVHNVEIDRLKHDFTKLRIDVVQVQFDSQVTKSEVYTLAQDFRALGVPQKPVAYYVNSASKASLVRFDIVYRIDYGFIESGFSASQWANKEDIITADLKKLGIDDPQSKVDQVIADLKAIAQSAGVTVDENLQYWTDESAVLSDLRALPNTHLRMDPFYYYSHHLRGFIHGQ